MPVLILPEQITSYEALDLFCKKVLKKSFMEVSAADVTSAAEPMRKLLASGHLGAWVLDGYTGQTKSISPEYWQGSDLWRTVSRDAFEDGIIILRRPELEAFLQDDLGNAVQLPDLDDKSHYVPPYLKYMMGLPKKLSLHSGCKVDKSTVEDFIKDDAPAKLRGKVKARYMAEFIWDHVVQLANSDDKRPYASPYLDYMMELSKSLNLRPEYNFDRSSVRDYIMERAPADLGGKEKARYMVTFIGCVEFERGGSKKAAVKGSSDRSSDPFAPFKDWKWKEPQRRGISDKSTLKPRSL